MLLVQKQRVISLILTVTDEYSELVIENAFDQVIATPAGKKAAEDEQSLTRMVLRA